MRHCRLPIAEVRILAVVLVALVSAEAQTPKSSAVLP